MANIPSSPCSGNETEVMLRFKHALGMSDELAAQAHVNLGLQLNRARVEISGS